MADALFACTKCNSRHPFEELTPDEQLCKQCKTSTLTVKCTYCRAEFKQNENGNTNSLCSKCDQNVKSYGKPTNCENCNILAAFIGSKCQRCANSERKWGPPQTCEQCKQRCAFDRNTESKNKVDGKTLCWLCTVAYRKVLEKARKQREESKSNHKASHHHQHHYSSSHHHHHGNKHKHGDRRHSGSAEKHHTEAHKSKMLHSDQKSHEYAGNKKLKLDKPSSNGVTPNNSQTAKSSTEAVLNDPSSSHHVIALTQLREEVESMKKQLQQKDQLIMDKDKQLTAMKAEKYEADKLTRDKINNLQKQHIEHSEQIQAKTRLVQKLQRQLQDLQKKVNKKSGNKEATHASSSPLLSVSASNSPVAN